MKHSLIRTGLLMITWLYGYAAAAQYTHADTLRGSNGPGRSWWDAKSYDIFFKPNFADSTISGSNLIRFSTLKKGSLMQIDLQEPLIIDSIVFSHWGKKGIMGSATTIRLPFTKDGNAYFVDLSSVQKKYKTVDNITVVYHGKPRIAKLPPWDGGLIWKKDKQNRPWMSIACQGLGASVWYPCKDIQSDEPETATLMMEIPDTLEAIANGRIYATGAKPGGNKVVGWEVTAPINNYNIIPYIGKYVHFSETYNGEKGPLDMDYWVLDYNLEKAKTQFKDAARMMKAFENWFGPYPFYEDGYKLVESPHLGMEHQSAIAYGNGYRNGYMGQDLSGSGWGLKWDFIIVHESGHEWFANNITTKDIADMWVHEGFTCYSETLFTEYYYGKEAATAYVTGLRKNIQNDIPIVGPYGVNKEGSGDMYYKAANMLHTIRQVINNDFLFRSILRGLNSTFYHQTITGKQVEDYICQQSKTDFSKVFDQYLRTVQIPVLEYKINGKEIQFRYSNCVDGFNLPVKVQLGADENSMRWITPATLWQTLKLADWYDGNTFKPVADFYINTKKTE